MPKAPQPADDESGAERIGGIIALLFYSLLVVEPVGITLLVGLTEIAPREAALFMLLPALAVWAIASTQRRLRSMALMFFPPYF
ncbi:MAG: hypothetical protein R3C30_02475 [Hyphomonadaceae bacterium]